MKAKKPTLKQEAIAQEFVRCGSAVIAYRKAYNPSDPYAKWVTVRAHNTINHPTVAARVKELRKDLAMENKIDQQFIIDKLLEIIGNEELTFELASKKEADKDTKARFYRMKEQIKSSDKLKALDQLAKMLGLNEATKIEVKDTSHTTEWGS